MGTWGWGSQAAALGFPSLVVPRRSGELREGRGSGEMGACPCRKPRLSEENQE